jgi:Arc/MetJ family transcription regulator
MNSQISPQSPADILSGEVAAAMTKTLIDVDDALLAEAQRLLGTTTKKETVNRALALVIADRERLEAVRAEIARGRSGFYERLLDEDLPWGR